MCTQSYLHFWVASYKIRMPSTFLHIAALNQGPHCCFKHYFDFPSRQLKMWVPRSNSSHNPFLLSPALWAFQINIRHEPQLKSSQTPILLLPSPKFQFCVHPLQSSKPALCEQHHIQGKDCTGMGGFKLSLPHTLTQCPLERSVSLST